MNKYSPAKKSDQRTSDNSLQTSNNNTAQQNDLIIMINKFEPQIKLALPKHLTASRMTRIIITELRKNPKLMECDRASLLGAIITCAQLGLEPGAGLGQAFLVPFWNKKTNSLECQLMIGYQGMVDLAERDGRVTVSSGVIYEKDTIVEMLRGSDEVFKIKPYFGNEGRGKLIGAFAVAKYKDGRSKFEVLNIDDIHHARSFSKSKNKDGEFYGPWADHFEAMARKTAVRSLFKMLPKSPEIARVHELEERAEISDSQGMSGVYAEFKEEHKNQLLEAPEESPDRAPVDHGDASPTL